MADDIKLCPYHVQLEKRVDKIEEAVTRLVKQAAVAGTENRNRDRRIDHLSAIADAHTDRLAKMALDDAANTIPLREHTQVMQDVDELRQARIRDEAVKTDSRNESRWTWQTAIAIIALIISIPSAVTVIILAARMASAK